MTEYELYLDRGWEKAERRYRSERRAIWRGIGWGSIFAAVLWAAIYGIATLVMKVIR